MNRVMSLVMLAGVALFLVGCEESKPTPTPSKGPDPMQAMQPGGGMAPPAIDVEKAKEAGVALPGAEDAAKEVDAKEADAKPAEPAAADAAEEKKE